MLQDIEVAVAILISAASLFIAWRKSKPEIRKTTAESQHSEAEAATTWAQSSKMAAEMVIQLQNDLAEERKLRLDLESKVQDIMNLLGDERTMRLRLEKRIKRLEAQVISMGKEPVE